MGGLGSFPHLRPLFFEKKNIDLKFGVFFFDFQFEEYSHSICLILMLCTVDAFDVLNRIIFCFWWEFEGGCCFTCLFVVEGVFFVIVSVFWLDGGL